MVVRSSIDDKFFSVVSEGGEAVRAARLESLPVEGQIRRIFGKDAQIALAVSQAENGSRACDRVSRPNRDGSVDIGVFQVNSNAHKAKATPDELKDCLTNIKVAKQIYDKSGWFPWVVYRTKSYLSYLK